MPNDTTTKFDENKEYGAYVEITPNMSRSNHLGLCGCIAVLLGVGWDEDSVDFARKMCEANYYKNVPREFHERVKIIEKPPTANGSPLESTGCVGWKYEPELVNA